MHLRSLRSLQATYVVSYDVEVCPDPGSRVEMGKKVQVSIPSSPPECGWATFCCPAKSPLTKSAIASGHDNGLVVGDGGEVGASARLAARLGAL